MDELIKTLKHGGFKGEVDRSVAERDRVSHDASIFEMRPSLVIAPYDAGDVRIAVKAVADLKMSHPRLSLTARSAGTDMSGGAINDSVIIDFNKHMRGTGPVTPHQASVLPGTFYRDFEPETLRHDAIMPTYPASREYCTVGGMVNNNAGGEKSLRYGSTINFVQSLRVVFADGIERDVRALTVPELQSKVRQHDFEGHAYRQMYGLCETKYDMIQAARPTVGKSSMGYNLWDVWDRDNKIFDLTKLFVGSQGTLGLTTDITFKLVPVQRHSGLLVMFLRDIGRLGDIITEVLAHKPTAFESFDDATLKLALRYMGSFRKLMSTADFARMVTGLALDLPQLCKGVPKLVLMVEFTGDDEAEVRSKIQKLHASLARHAAKYEINGFEEDADAGSSAKFWSIRRASFSLLREKVHDKYAAPFIDDLIVSPEYLPEFFPQLRALVKRHKLFATIAGHMGNGNFHIIPLMAIQRESERRKLFLAMREINELVLRYHGSLAGEHNDGLIRGPWLGRVYGQDMLELFKHTKRIFDPHGIFNPHKKADADWDFSADHIRRHF